MAIPDKKLFRAETLERLSSPDDLERLMPVARAGDWLLIAVTGAIIALLAVWAFAGRVPTIVAGRGVILRPRQIMEAQTTVAGKLLTLKVRGGDRVREGDVIATLDQSEILKRIQENRRAIDVLEAQDQRKNAADQRQTALQNQQDTMERSGLATQRAALRKNLADAESLRPVLQSHVESNRKMVQEKLLGFAAKDVADSESAIRDNDAKIADYTARLGQIDAQLQQIETRGATLARQILEASLARRNEIDQLRRSIVIDEFQIRQDGSIRSQYSGRVAEVLAAAGQVLPAGGRLLTLEMEDAGVGLLSISYFPVRDGKRIHPGMRLQVTPDTVERERFGGILGTVSSVSPVPVTKAGATTTIGNAEVVQNLMPEGGYIEVRAQLDPDLSTASGYRWSSSRGPDMKVTAGLTHSTRVTIEGRAPVTYLLPVLREMSGVY
ncbi:MAG: bacteriocin system secretion protein [Candidatus Solibacter sp.]|nr:bacteriocin system secretion protein [Candidatus Solibacter sp.]